MLKLGVLGLLVHQAGDVFALESAVEELFNDLWPGTRGEISRALVDLEAEGLVHDQGLPGRTLPERPIYEPTPEGRQRVAEWLQEPSGTEIPIEDEMALKLTLNRLLDADHGLALVWAEQQKLSDELDGLTTLRDSGTLNLPATLLLERAIMMREARNRWLTFCEQRLVEQSGPPALVTGR
jgi:DNA-binding PadR family transcriptional regulator